MTMTSVTPIETALDLYPKPACAELLGWRVLDARPRDGWIRIGFEGRPQFRNPAGFIQGGFLAAMLDDTMGPAVLVMSEGATYTATIDMNVSYLRPGEVGPIVGEGQVIHLGKTIGFVEGRLINPAGEVLARATATVRLIAAEKAMQRA